MKRATFRHLIHRGIQNEDELRFIVKDVLGVAIPEEVCCDDHQPLWEAFVDDFFYRVSKQAIRHCRGGGKTKGVATAKATKLLAYGGLRISNFAATENQAYSLFGYVTEMLGPNADPEVQRRVEEVRNAMAQTKPMLAVGRERPESSKMRVIVGTLKGVNSEHVDDLVQDERAQMDDAVAKESIGMMTARAPYPGILTVLSTVKQKGDGMDKLLDEADERGYKTYVSCILDVTNCQQKNCDGCKKTRSYSKDRQKSKSFYDYCGGRILGRNLGHFSVPVALNKFVEMGLEAADAQLFSASPEGEENAFPEFSRSAHVHDLRALASGRPFYIMGDFGKSDNSVFLKAYEFNDGDLIYIDQEAIGNGRTIQEWIPDLTKQGFGNASAWLVDVAGRQTTITSKKSAIEYLEDEDWVVVAEKMEELPTTERLRDLLKEDSRMPGLRRIVVHPGCKQTIQAFERATNKSRGTGDDRVFEKVIKHNKFSHPIDAVRYGANLLSPDEHEEGPGRYRIGRKKK